MYVLLLRTIDSDFLWHIIKSYSVLSPLYHEPMSADDSCASGFIFGYYVSTSLLCRHPIPSKTSIAERYGSAHGEVPSWCLVIYWDVHTCMPIPILLAKYRQHDMVSELTKYRHRCYREQLITSVLPFKYYTCGECPWFFLFIS